MYRKVILQIIKDEHDYLDYWIQYHSKLGFDFILIEDYFSESHEEICNKYDNVTLIKLFDFLSPHRIDNVKQGEFRQYTILEEFVDKNCTGMYDYDVCLFIDPDEYLINCDLYSLNIICKKLLKEKNVPAYLIKWKWMTSNDKNVILDENPDLSIPVYERFKDNVILYTSTGKEKYETKMLINLRFFDNYDKLCIYKYNKDYYQHTSVPHYLIDSKNIDNIYIHHYCTNSIKEYIKRLVYKGEMTNEDFKRKLDFFYEINNNYKTEINDYLIKHNLQNIITKTNIFI